MRQDMVAALCFGSIFGIPFIVWGVILIFDRDRTWQRSMRRARGDRPAKRTRAWDRRQILVGALLVVFGGVILLALAAFNYLAQSISPPAPF